MIENKQEDGMDATYKKARRLSGEARYERTQTRKTRGIGGRMQLAHNVPGTPEHGQLCMYHYETERIVTRLRAAMTATSGK